MTETTVRLTGPGGIDSGEMTLSEFERRALRLKDHGSKPMFSDEETGTTVAAAELRQLIERIERLEEERKALGDDIKDVKAEAKGRGYDLKAINTIVRLRKKDTAERQEEEAILDLYKAALGMV